MKGRATNHSEQCLDTEQISISNGQLSLHGESILEVAPSLLVFFLWYQVGHDPQTMGDGEGNVQARPPARPFIRIMRVMLLDQMHKRWLVKQWEHAIEVLELVFEKRVPL